MKKFLFHDLELDIPDDVYYPREDSVLLAEVLDDLMLKNKNCLEMGCGAGLSSIVMAKKEASVTSVDVDVEAVKAVKHNSDKLSLNITALQSNLFNNINEPQRLFVSYGNNKNPKLQGEHHYGSKAR